MRWPCCWSKSSNAGIANSSTPNDVILASAPSVTSSLPAIPCAPIQSVVRWTSSCTLSPVRDGLLHLYPALLTTLNSLTSRHSAKRSTPLTYCCTQRSCSFLSHWTPPTANTTNYTSPLENPPTKRWAWKDSCHLDLFRSRATLSQRAIFATSISLLWRI